MNLAQFTVTVGQITMKARSSVFASMLTLPMRETTERTVTINDLSTSGVKAMITFMYAGRIDEDLHSSREIL